MIIQKDDSLEFLEKIKERVKENPNYFMTEEGQKDQARFHEESMKCLAWLSNWAKKEKEKEVKEKK